MNIIIQFLNSNQKIEGALPLILDELNEEFIEQNFTKASAKEVLDNNLIGMKYTNYKKN